MLLPVYNYYVYILLAPTYSIMSCLLRRICCNEVVFLMQKDRTAGDGLSMSNRTMPAGKDTTMSPVNLTRHLQFIKFTRVSDDTRTYYDNGHVNRTYYDNGHVNRDGKMLAVRENIQKELVKSLTFSIQENHLYLSEDTKGCLSLISGVYARGNKRSYIIMMHHSPKPRQRN